MKFYRLDKLNESLDIVRTYFYVINVSKLNVSNMNESKLVNTICVKFNDILQESVQRREVASSDSYEYSMHL